MRKVERVFVEYVGYKNPESLDELELELCGLRTAIAAAQARITALEQSRQLYKMGLINEETIKQGLSNQETESESGAGLGGNSSQDEKKG